MRSMNVSSGSYLRYPKMGSASVRQAPPRLLTRSPAQGAPPGKEYGGRAADPRGSLTSLIATPSAGTSDDREPAGEMMPNQALVHRFRRYRSTLPAAARSR